MQDPVIPILGKTGAIFVPQFNVFFFFYSKVVTAINTFFLNFSFLSIYILCTKSGGYAKSFS